MEEVFNENGQSDNEENHSLESHQKNHKSIKKNYFYNLAYQIFMLIVPLIVTPYVSRVLTPDGIGKYSFTFSLITYFTIAGALGFGNYAQREIAKHQNNKYNQSKTFWEIIICRSLSVSIVLIINIIFCVFKIYGDYTNLMWIFNINIIALYFDIAFLYQGNEEFGHLVFRNFIIKTISIVCIFIFVKQISDLWVYTLINALSVLLSSISMWTVSYKFLVKVNKKDLLPFRHLKGTLILFLPTIATSIYTVLDKTLIGFLIKDTYVIEEETMIDGVKTITTITKKYSDLENGYYEQSEKLVKMAMTIITSIGTVMIPRNSSEFAHGNIMQVKRNIIMSLKIVFMIGLPLVFGFIAIASNVVPWFFGDGYNKCIELLSILAPLILIIGISNVLGLQFLLPSGQDKKFATSLILGAVVNLILNLILIPPYWSVGAAISTIISELIVTFSMVFYLRKEINILKIMICCWKYLVSAIVMFLICYFLSSKMDASISNSCIIAFVGFFVYISMLIVFKDQLIYDFIKKYKNSNSNSKSRMISFDLLKVIACIGVLLLHTVNFEYETINLILYNVGVFSLPIFIVIDGYLLLKKDNISFKYCFKKILRILILIAPFLFISFCYRLFRTKDFILSLSELYSFIFQRGLFNIYWYFAMLILLYLFLPILKKIFDNKTTNIFFLILLIIVNIMINLISIISKNNLNSHVIQTFRLWIWLLYFMLGGFLYRYEDKLFKLNIIVHFILTIIVVLCSIILVFYLEKYYFVDWLCEYYYGYLIIILSVLLIVMLIKRLDLSKLSGFITKFSSLTLGVYLIHMLFALTFNFVLKKLGYEMTSFYALVKFLFVLIASFFVSYIINEIPFVRKLFIL